MKHYTLRSFHTFDGIYQDHSVVYATGKEAATAAKEYHRVMGGEWLVISHSIERNPKIIYHFPITKAEGK